MDVESRRKRAKRRKKYFLILMMYHYNNDIDTLNATPRKLWQRQWLAARDSQSAYHNIVQELRLQDPENYRRYLRMNVDTFDYVLEKLRPFITKQTTVMRKPISAEEQLAITLRYLATGESFSSLMFQYRVSELAIRQLIPRVCFGILDTLMDEWMSFPKCAADWERIAKGYEDKWNVPNCIGSLDGKHVALKKPPNSVSNYINYKSFHSIIMMALVDADYRFIDVSIGAQGRLGDGAVFKDGSLYRKLVQNRLNLPPDKSLPGDENSNKLPYIFLADDAFPLKRNIMKPYAKKDLSEGKRIFNYRLSRGRRTVENAFGILSQVFRIFFSTISVNPAYAKLITLSCCVLHNILRTLSRDKYTPHGYADSVTENGDVAEGRWRQLPQSPMLLPLQPDPCKKAPYAAEEIRDYLKEYFQGNGSVPWQYQEVYT